MDCPIDTSLPLACQSLVSLSDALQRKQITSVDVVESCLERVEQLNPKLNALVETFTDSALEQARACDQMLERNIALGPLHGIPVAIKDVFAIKGRILGGGSRCRGSELSHEDAQIVAMLRSRGQPILARAHTVEFSYGGWGISNSLGTPWNPWDMDVHRVPGGSSNGSGVALAAGLVPAAVGGDTGGSVRLPASWCGLTALKVTQGVLPVQGMLPLSSTLDTPGPMARSAVDAALLFESMGGGSTAGILSGGDLSGVRLATLPKIDLNPASRDVRDAYRQALEQLSELGAVIVERALPASLDEINDLTGVIMAAEGYFNLARYIDDLDLPVDPDIRDRLLSGRTIPAHAYLATMNRRNQLIKMLHATFADCTAILSPTTPWTALPVSDVDQSMMSSYYTRFANLLSMCAVALPIGKDSTGLPVSMQISAFGGRETDILRIAAQYQAVTAWHGMVSCVV